MGVSHFVDTDLETRHKWAILELFHTIELLLKERLSREHPLLIYRRIDKPLGDDSQTVGLNEALARFANLEIELPKEYVKILQDLRRRRNRIEHHRFIAESSHEQVLGEALAFIRYFLEEHLEEDIEEHLTGAQFDMVKELILSYEEQVERAERALDIARSKFSPKEQSVLDTGTCPQCGNDTVLQGESSEPYCYFCEENVSVAACNYCGRYVDPDELIGGSICSYCFSYKMERD